MKDPEVMIDFDPSGTGIKGNLFGLPFSLEQAKIIVVPVPWEVTVSYQTGTMNGPEAILDASSQVDLCQKDLPDIWKYGINMLPISDDIKKNCTVLRELALQHIRKVEEVIPFSPNDPILVKINEACETLNIFIKTETLKLIKQGKKVGLLGGDHSTPLGYIRALADVYDKFGILQIDAHADLRKAYEGFTYSHASIMYNALKLPAVSRLVQVGIRDYGEEELNVISRSMGRIKTFFDDDIKAEFFKGRHWDNICDIIIKELPSLVYISFDIDGLNPKLCPNTGTPVPGGMEFEHITYLFKKLAKAGKRIIGFDLCEVAPGNDEWDANVGARMLYNMCNWMAVSSQSKG